MVTCITIRVIYTLYYLISILIITWKNLRKVNLYFKKTFNPLVESDSLDLIEEAGKLVDHCYNYAFNASSALDTLFFARQKNLVASYISDYYSRKGTSEILSEWSETSLIVRLDTLTQAGIYKWKGNIIVVGHFMPAAINCNVRKGEAIMNADRRLIEYLRVNRLDRFGKKMKIGHTYLIHYIDHEKTIEFMYNPYKNSYQYIVCYTRIESDYFTRRLGQFLPPLEFGSQSL